MRLAIALWAIAIGLWAVLPLALDSLAARELEQLLPTDVEWSGPTRTDGGVAPLLIWRSYRSPSMSEAKAHLERTLVLVASTRSGNVHVFRRGAETIYLASEAGVSRIELQRYRACDAFGTPFPARPDDVFLQFGGTPAGAIGTMSTRFGTMSVRPCPSAGFWMVGHDPPAAIFTGLGPARTTYRLSAVRPPSAVAEGTTAGPFLPQAWVTQEPGGGRYITWFQDVWRTYGGIVATDDLNNTVCRSVRLGIVC